MCVEAWFLSIINLKPPLEQNHLSWKAFLGSCHHLLSQTLNLPLATDHDSSILGPLTVCLPTCTFARACVQIAHFCITAAVWRNQDRPLCDGGVGPTRWVHTNP